MTRTDSILTRMKNNSNGVRFPDLKKVCDHYFGKARVRGDHFYYTMPWAEMPLVNIQPGGNMAKSYQVKQVLQAIKKFTEI